MNDCNNYDIDTLLEKINLLEKEKNLLLLSKVKHLEEENIILRRNNAILTENIKTQGNQIEKISSEINKINKNILKNPQNVVNQKNTEIKPPAKSENKQILPFEYEFIYKAISSRLKKQVKNLKILYKASKDGDMINAMIL